MTGQGPLAGLTVRSVMRSLNSFVTPRDLITHARAVMRETGARVLPVIDGGRVEGIITQRDVIKVTSTRSNIFIGGVMSPLTLILTPTVELATAAREMVERGLDEAPVVDGYATRNGVGIIKIEDILSRLEEAIPQAITVSDVMVKDVVCCSEEDDIPAVWKLMEESNFSGLPVVREERGKRKVVGMIARSDLVRKGLVRTAGESKKGKTAPKVKSIMRTPVITVPTDTKVKAAIRLMREKNIKRLPVTDRDTLVGIITRSDIIRRFCR
ncbi:MAG: CBS domain-containing protein [Candidatus Hadarchaeales archaeon]